MRTALLYIAALICAGWLIGCNTGPEMDVDMTGSLTYGSCGEVLPWSPGLAAVVDTDATDVVMRFQAKSGKANVVDDTLLFVIDDADSLYQNPNATIEVGDREYGGARASANFTLPVSCPDDISLSVFLYGTLHFDALSHTKHGRVSGSFDGSAVDERTGDTIGTAIHLDFDFERTDRAPWQSFLSQ